jgi:hypothetical protein
LQRQSHVPTTTITTTTSRVCDFYLIQQQQWTATSASILVLNIKSNGRSELRHELKHRSEFIIWDFFVGVPLKDQTDDLLGGFQQCSSIHGSCCDHSNLFCSMPCVCLHYWFQEEYVASFLIENLESGLIISKDLHICSAKVTESMVMRENCISTT